MDAWNLLDHEHSILCGEDTLCIVWGTSCPTRSERIGAGENTSCGE